MTDYDLGGDGPRWVGIDNFVKIFTQTRYMSMFGATLTYVLTVTPLSIGLGLGAALLIHSLRWGGAFYKTVFFLPVMATLMAMSVVWSFALHPTLGIVNSTLASFCGGKSGAVLHRSQPRSLRWETPPRLERVR